MGLDGWFGPTTLSFWSLAATPLRRELRRCIVVDSHVSMLQAFAQSRDGLLHSYSMGSCLESGARLCYSTSAFTFIILVSFALSFGYASSMIF